MKYDMKELVPIVAKLAEGYTSKQSTSITYERAQQLMGAVLYCIQEANVMNPFSIMEKDGIPAYEMYKIGVSCVEKKTKETLDAYNELMTYFTSYENVCLKDTVEKGLPEFFKWYDCKYEPQNTILTLDYPILQDISQYSGIDRISEYVMCIQAEQKFLSQFPGTYVIEVLSRYDSGFRLMIDNVCEIVLMDVLLHIIAGKEMGNIAFESEECRKLQEIIQKISLEKLREKLEKVIEEMVLKFYENDECLEQYLFLAVNNISVRIKNAAEYGTLENLVNFTKKNVFFSH